MNERSADMLPKRFQERMMALLGEDYPAFEAALEKENVKGCRINPLKCSDDEILSRMGYPKIPYAKNGYYLPKDTEGIGNTPYHHSGAIYVQDPGAMASLCALPDGELLSGGAVCDLCAAPGGKTGQAAALIGDGGFILSNEYVPKRAKILVSNLERLGVKNAVVTSLDTADIAKLYNSFFDLVIADAPCSGEGMFRKTDAAIEEWSEENIENCAKRQKYILDNASSLVKDGGYLLYSTCTYAIEENEMQIDGFLLRHPDYELCPVNEALIPYTAEGIQFEGATCKNLSLTRRFYPHKAEGEGQFIALLKRKTEDAPKILFNDFSASLSAEEMRICEGFLKENLLNLPSHKLIKYGNNPVLIMHGMPIPRGSVFSSGILLGEIRGKLLFPSHQLFSALGHLFKRKVNIEDDAVAARYLKGEEICLQGIENGYTAVQYNGVTLGGGKASSGVVKNHYPKGLRLKG